MSRDCKAAHTSGLSMGEPYNFKIPSYLTGLNIELYALHMYATR